MEQVFKSVLLLSSVGAVLSGAIFLLKPVTKRVFGSHWQYYIWLCVLVVMILPVSFKMSVKTNINITAPQGQQAVQENNNVRMDITNRQTLAVANDQTPIEYHNIDIAKGITLNSFGIIICVWLLGVVIFFCGGLVSYLRFLRAIRKNSIVAVCPELEAMKDKKGIKRKIRVRITELLTAPLMVGIFKPTLLLPNTQMSEKELHYILLHELTHLKRNDLWYKWFAMLVNAVHWFNPLVYVVTRQINEECEVSCDLSVTKDMSGEEKNSYMNTILYLLSTNIEKSIILSTAMANNKKQIKRRFIMIRKVKKQNRFMSVISVITAAAVLSVSVLASGVMANQLLNDEYKIEVYKGDTMISFDNQPFTENGELYLPLRKLLNKFGVSNENILWSDNGTISLISVQSNENGSETKASMDIAINEYSYTMRGSAQSGQDNHIDVSVNPNKVCTLINPPIMKGNTTFVPYELLVKLNGETSMLNRLAVAVVSDNWDTLETSEQLRKAIAWANALKTRDGEPRYEMMSEQMKQAFMAEQINRSGEPWNFNIGWSSPWVVNFDIELIDNTANIVYHTTDSTTAKYDIRETLVFTKEGNNLIVTDAKYEFEE